MSDRKKLLRKKKEPEEVPVDEDKPSKLEYEVAKYLRNNLPQRKTTLLRDKVEYFISSKAINCLLDSKWAIRKAGDPDEPLFTTRESVADFLNLMLQHRFFHRAKKILIKEKKKIKDNDELSGDNEFGKRKDKKKSSEETKKKEKIKIKLDFHLDQVVVDSNEPYVWIYDPISFWSWIFGFLLVFGVVALCLFPLWPSTLRNVVYYLSVLAAVFLVTIMTIALLKIVIFFIIWCITFGKHHFWLLPNLTEDVGFFASFWPLYYHTTSDEKLKEKEKEREKEREKSKTKKLKSNNPSPPSTKTEEKKLKKNLDKEEETFEEELNESKSDEIEVLKKGDVSDSSENDSLKNNGFEIVDGNEVPAILDLKL